MAIQLNNDCFNIIALMCGHDASHDFFQKPPKGWASKKSEYINTDTSLTGGALHPIMTKDKIDKRTKSKMSHIPFKRSIHVNKDGLKKNYYIH